MTNTSTAKAAGGVAAIANAFLLVLVGFGVIAWTELQIGAVVLAITGGVAVLAALRAHLRAGTSAEPVALFASLLALASSIIGVLLVFEAVTAAQGGLLAGLVTTIGMAIGIPVVRSQVYPTSNLQHYPNVEPQQHFTGEAGGSLLAVITAAALVAIAVGVLIIALG